MQLHFPGEELKHRSSMTKRDSSIMNIDFSEIKHKGAGNLWRTVLESSLSKNGSFIRGVYNDIYIELFHKFLRIEAEQTIVPWQSDKDVSLCPICKYVCVHLYLYALILLQLFFSSVNQPETSLQDLWSCYLLLASKASRKSTTVFISFCC